MDIQSIIAVAATLAGLVTSSILHDLRAQTLEPVMVLAAQQTTRVLTTRSLALPATVRMPIAPAREGLPQR